MADVDELVFQNTPSTTKDGEKPSTAPPPPSETDAAIAALRSSVEDQRSRSVYACGGKVPVVLPSSQAAQEGKNRSRDAVTSQPIDLRWDAVEGGGEVKDVSSKRTKLVLPLEPRTRDNLDQLLADTQPATFGRGGEDVYDEKYRKAAKMDPSQFSTSFNPYTLGIVDEIAQSLLPSAAGSEPARAVRAELYKLNIYSGPSGRFKAHVDTPRAADQFGSLVVCLPLEHEGGALAVRHEGNSIAFDWGKEGKSEEGAFIRWAAFYSDCEHEVLEVTSGHRLTLTYNLYAIRGNGLLAGHCQTLDAAQLPLYKQVVGILKNASFMTEGGCLGFYCQHAYPHTSEASGLPDTLKGIDMMLYEIFRAIGYKAYLRPVLRDPFADSWTGDLEEQGIKQLHIGGSFKFRMFDTREIEDYGHFTEAMDGFRAAGCEEGERQFHEDDIVWATEPKHKEAQFTYTAYGNQAETEVLYSNCAIIVEIPAWAERKAAATISG
ncbi:hypothetical protein SLS62_003088 [Diatrype stigma]|uniref:Fe2OG dioxygenase domain-containing protein n=1 Tax=Diatrype stigma TaxID=117547 RepID=A0AAN9UT51_9PEZI